MLVWLFGCSDKQKQKVDASIDEFVGRETLSADVLDTLDGLALYEKYCQECHGDIESTTIKGQSEEHIKAAIQNIPQMQEQEFLHSITDEEIKLISDVLLLPSEDRMHLACQQSYSPPEVLMRRLSREEYNLTIQDLFSISISPADKLPEESKTYNFDNIASAMTMTPSLMRSFLAAAIEVVDTAFAQSRDKLITCNLDDNYCVDSIFLNWGKRILRRPVSAERLSDLREIFNNELSSGRDPISGLKRGFEYLLVSPQFLYRIVSTASGQIIDAYSLAERLAYFIWSSTPDDTLLGKAESNHLNSRDQLLSEVNRMLSSQKSQRLVNRFAMSWLGLDSFNEKVNFDSTKFPEASEQLKKDMLTQTKYFVDYVFKSDRPINDFLLSDYGFFNQRLAQYLGIESNISDPNKFEKVDLTATDRRGIVTQPAVLAITSTAQRTSVVRRGKWILDNLLCYDQGITPPDIPALPEENSNSQTLQEMLAEHRSNPVCAACHNVLDPLGFVLEGFGVTGKIRSLDDFGNTPDTFGQLPTGESFSSAADMLAAIEAKNEFTSCLTEKLITYAVGRFPKRTMDRCAVTSVAEANGGGDKSFKELLLDLLAHDMFRKQGTEMQGDNP